MDYIVHTHTHTRCMHAKCKMCDANANSMLPYYPAGAFVFAQKYTFVHTYIYALHACIHSCNRKQNECRTFSTKQNKNEDFSIHWKCPKKENGKQFAEKILTVNFSRHTVDTASAELKWLHSSTPPSSRRQIWNSTETSGSSHTKMVIIESNISQKFQNTSQTSL